MIPVFPIIKAILVAKIEKAYCGFILSGMCNEVHKQGVVEYGRVYTCHVWSDHSIGTVESGF